MLSAWQPARPGQRWSKLQVSHFSDIQRADIAIEDQGCGFNPCPNVPNPTDDANLEMCSGRGILLMRAYMSSVVFNPAGNKVTMTKFNERFQSGELNSHGHGVRERFFNS